MAVEIKVAPDEKLELVRAQIIDNSLNSNYFNVTELSDTFSGGKNAFLIAGSELLEPNTEVKVQIRDSAGEVLYCEFSDGYPTEYYEGISKVVAVYVYPTETAFGPATITIIGQIKDTLDLVKWERKINIDPSLPNTTRVRFYKRPSVSIVEQLAPIYAFDATGSKVASNVTQSFANIKVSQLDTFAGDVKRVKVYRTSEGDISDYDLIQDILVESKELLTTTELSGSVVGEAGLFTSETLKKLWNTGSLSAALTSSRIDNGLSLKGSGYLRYTSSLNLTNGNTYELGIDAFYSASTASDMGIYISGSQNGATLIGTLSGTTPTKNLKDQVYSFTLDSAEPTASLYLSQSQSEWHVGNISLKLSEDSAFSPSEISFVTSMPTVIGNETYNFKFEFYDVNNNYVPVAVTQSALFTGGNNNIGGTITLISGSTSALSKSVSYDLWFNPTGSITSSIQFVSQSASSSLSLVSSSVSGTISNVSSSLSASVFAAKSASFAQVKSLADGNYSGVFIDGTTVYAPTIGGTQGYISQLFTVGSTAAATINLDARTTTRKIWIGTSANGTYSSTDTTVYLDSSGKFSLGNKLTWDGNTLNVTGVINITSGPTYDAIGTAQSTANSANSAASAAQSTANSAASAASTAQSTANAADAKIFNDVYGKLIKAPDVGSGGGGLYLGNTNMGYYGSQGWMTYMDNSGLFYLKGSNGSYGLQWNPGSNSLTIDGTVTARSGYIGNGTSGWAIGSTAITSTTGQTVLNSNGVIVLNGSTPDYAGSYEKIRITYATVPTSVAQQQIQYSNTSYTPTTVYATFPVNTYAQTKSTDWQYNGQILSVYNFTAANTGQALLSFPTENWQAGALDAQGYPNYLGYIDTTLLNGAQTGVSGVAQVEFFATLFDSTGTIALNDTVTWRPFYYYAFNISKYGGYIPGPIAGAVSLPFTSWVTQGTQYKVRVELRYQVSATVRGASTLGPFPTGTWSVTAYGPVGRQTQASLSSTRENTFIGINGVAIGTNTSQYAAIGTVAGDGLVGNFIGNINVAGSIFGTINSLSDVRLKNNIIPITDSLNKLKLLNPVSFDWSKTANPYEMRDRGYGFIAQEVEEVLPELIQTHKVGIIEDAKTIEYASLHGLQIAAIQQMMSKIEQLENRILELEEKQ